MRGAIVTQVSVPDHEARNGEEDDRGKIAINPDSFDKLVTALKTAVDNDGTLDKEAMSYNDIFDAFRLALKFYDFEAKKDDY